MSPTGAGVTNLGASGFSRGSSPRQFLRICALFGDGENVTWWFVTSNSGKIRGHLKSHGQRCFGDSFRIRN